MEFVVDANILFSALIRNSHTRHFLLLCGHSFYVPEFVFDEIFKHMSIIENKTGLPKDEIKAILKKIITMANINVVPVADFRKYSKKAKEISPDPDDTVYFALALKLNCPIWSNDLQLKKQDSIKVYTTEEIIKIK